MMDDKTINDNNAYDELLKSFSATKKTETKSNEGEVKNHGEIYFSANSPRAAAGRPVIQRTGSQQTPQTASQPASDNVQKKGVSKGGSKKASSAKKAAKKSKKKKNGRSFF